MPDRAAPTDGLRADPGVGSGGGRSAAVTLRPAIPAPRTSDPAPPAPDDRPTLFRDPDTGALRVRVTDGRAGLPRHASRALEAPTGPFATVQTEPIPTIRAIPAPEPTRAPTPLLESARAERARTVEPETSAIAVQEASTTPAPHTGRWELWVSGLVLAALSGMVLTWPFRGDQAVFAAIGRQILHGQTLYVDLWDVKQPGIFLWYGLFGFGEIGMRALDVLMAFGFGATVWALLRRRTESARLRRLLPVLATGTLLLAAGPGDFGQLEMLCLVPAVGAFAFVAATPGPEIAFRRIVLAGLCVGIIGVFKLLLAAVAGVALLVYLGFALRRHRIAAGVVLTATAFVPVLAVLAWLAAQGALRETLHVWIVEAAQMGAAPGSRSPARVAEGLGRYLAWMFPVVVLAAWRSATAWRRRDALDLAMIAFVLLDVVAIATQFAWWYQWYFASAPLVVLALRQLDVVRWRPRTAVVLGLVCLPMLAHASSWALPTVLDGGGLTAASRERIDERVADYSTIRAELAAADVQPTDSLYVLGDPLYNRLSGTPLSVRFDGWTYDLMSDDQWSEVAREVAAVHPSVIMVSTDAAGWVTDRGPQVREVLDRDYVQYRTSDEGTWYRLRS